METLKNILYFLRNFPAWIPLLFVFVFLILLYYKTSDVAYKEWAGLAFAALTIALGIQRSLPPQNETPPQSTISLENIKPDEINFSDIDNKQGEK